jgi:hypothetical protein
MASTPERADGLGKLTPRRDEREPCRPRALAALRRRRQRKPTATGAANTKAHHTSTPITSGAATVACGTIVTPVKPDRALAPSSLPQRNGVNNRQRRIARSDTKLLLFLRRTETARDTCVTHRGPNFRRLWMSFADLEKNA